MGSDGEKNVEKVDSLLEWNSRRKASTVKAARIDNTIKHSRRECEWDTSSDSLRNSVMIFSDLL